MDVLTHYDQLPNAKEPTVLTVGNFDGVHLGHHKIIEEIKTAAEQYGAKTLVMTFEPHPSVYFDAGRRPDLLTPLPCKQRLLEQAGIDILIVQPFNEQLASMEPEDFVEQVVLERAAAKAVIVGTNFTFGRHGRGDLGLLAEMGLTLGFDAHGVEPVEMDGRPVSSTWVREVLHLGDVALAARLLGRPYEIMGEVEKGSGRGAGLGFPTANLGGIGSMVPAHGVYAAMADVDGEPHPAALYIGTRPTFQDSKAVEVHLLDNCLDLQGKPMIVKLIDRIREDRAFSDPESLKAQIGADIGAVKHLLSKHLHPGT